MYSVNIGDYFDVFLKAASYVRKYHALPNSHVIQKEFEETFDVKIVYTDSINEHQQVEFKSEEDFLMFVLRWT